MSKRQQFRIQCQMVTESRISFFLDQTAISIWSETASHKGAGAVDGALIDAGIKLNIIFIEINFACENINRILVKE